MLELLPLLLDGAWLTIRITAAAAIVAIVMALVAALGCSARLRPLRWLATAYVEIFRGTSLLVQLFWLYFVLPLPPFRIELSPFAVAILGLGLHIGAYGAELMRGAFSAVPKGQREAAIALNLPPAARFFRVILPQALRNAIPPGTNLLIELLKCTSMVSLITLGDLSFRANQLVQATFRSGEIFMLTLLIYFLLSQSINFVMKRLERRLNHGYVQGGL
jgi:polar amino acid transport system permease protein